MAAMTLAIDIPDTVTYNRQVLQQQLSAFAKILITYAPTVKAEEKKEDMHIFDCFSGDWGGDQDSHEIADELYAGRENTFDGKENIEMQHVAEAVSYRQLDRGDWCERV